MAGDENRVVAYHNPYRLRHIAERRARDSINLNWRRRLPRRGQSPSLRTPISSNNASNRGSSRSPSKSGSRLNRRNGFLSGPGSGGLLLFLAALRTTARRTGPAILLVALRTWRVSSRAQVAHFLFVGWRARFAAGHITGSKLFFGFEDSRFEKRQQVVKLDERILNGCGREQHQEALVESVDQFPVRGRAVLQMVRLVDDHQVVILFGQNLLMLGAPRHRD